MAEKRLHPHSDAINQRTKLKSSFPLSLAMNDSLTDLWVKHESMVYSLKALDRRDPMFDSSLVQSLLQLRKINLFIVERLRVLWDKETFAFHDCWGPRLFDVATCLHWMASKKSKKHAKVIGLNVKLNPFLSSTRINGKTAILQGRNRQLPSSLKMNPIPAALQMNSQQEELCISLGKFLYLIYNSHHPDTKILIQASPPIDEVAPKDGHPTETLRMAHPSQDELELARCLKQWKFKITQLRRYRCLAWSVNRRIERDVCCLTR